MADIYCTSYCNHGHRLKDGKPVEHGCHILPPAALAAERAGDIDRARALIQAAKPLREMARGVKRPKVEGAAHFIAANSHEGCGHRHRTRQAAARCLSRIDREHGRVKVYRIEGCDNVGEPTPEQRSRELGRRMAKAEGRLR